MAIRNRVFIGGPISSFGLVTLLWAGPAEAGQPYLCTSIPSACEYAGPAAPALNAAVCWNGSTALLAGGSACPSGSRAYWVGHGSIDPLTGAVQAYIALDDACTQGWCSELTPGTAWPNEGGEVCCQPEPLTGTCTLEVLNCAGEVLWCEGYQSNNDGTIECMQAND